MKNLEKSLNKEVVDQYETLESLMVDYPSVTLFADAKGIKQNEKLLERAKKKAKFKGIVANGNIIPIGHEVKVYHAYGASYGKLEGVRFVVHVTSKYGINDSAGHLEVKLKETKREPLDFEIFPNEIFDRKAKEFTEEWFNPVCLQIHKTDKSLTLSELRDKRLDNMVRWFDFYKVSNS